jgi:hypothetical protein
MSRAFERQLFDHGQNGLLQRSDVSFRRVRSIASVQPSELPASISSARCRSVLIAMAQCRRRSAAPAAPEPRWSAEGGGAMANRRRA